MEYLPCGDLLGYLRKCRGVRDRYYLGEGRAQNLTNYDLVLFAKQIAAGMVFLGTQGVSGILVTCQFQLRKNFSEILTFHFSIAQILANIFECFYIREISKFFLAIILFVDISRSLQMSRK